MSHYLCKIADIGQSGKEVCVKLNSKAVYIMLFPYAGTIRAFINICPHQGMPLNQAPDKFMFSGEGFLMCAQHGARFELDTGKCVGGACRGANLQIVSVTLEGDSVWLEHDFD
jgi:nitrite reductase/ring-hydroxylating ferredoxin subunit